MRSMVWGIFMIRIVKQDANTPLALAVKAALRLDEAGKASFDTFDVIDGEPDAMFAEWRDKLSGQLEVVAISKNEFGCFVALSNREGVEVESFYLGQPSFG